MGEDTSTEKEHRHKQDGTCTGSEHLTWVDIRMRRKPHRWVLVGQALKVLGRDKIRKRAHSEVEVDHRKSAVSREKSADSR